MFSIKIARVIHEYLSVAFLYVLSIVNFPFLDGDVLRRTSYGVYIYRLIRFARASSNVSDFNCRNKALTVKLLRQGLSLS